MTKFNNVAKGLLSVVFLIIMVNGIMMTSCSPQAKRDKKNNTGEFSRIDSLFQNAIVNHEIPAAAVYLAHKGQPIYYKGFGMKDIESGAALAANDIFRIASMTKVVTSLAIMQLAERGMLMLDDPLSHFLPEFANPRVLIEVLPDSSFTSRPAVGEITIHHLLTHTSGIGYGFQSEMYNSLVIKNGITEGFEERPIHLRNNIRALSQLPLLHDPGTKYTYGLNMDVLGAVVEVVSGETLDDYFYHHIFKPLGMHDTHFYLPEEKAARLVSVYEYNSDNTGFIPATYPFTQYPVRGARTYFSGGADLCSTAQDIGLFAQMMLNKGELYGIRVIGSRYVEMMTTKQSEYSWWNSEVGFGVSINTVMGASMRPASEGSYGWGGFFDTYCWVDQDKEIVAVLLLQMYPTNEFRIHEKFQHITYGIIDDL